MPFSRPPSLEALLAAREDADREAAWAAFLREYSEVLLRVARRLGGDHDAIMDRYAFAVAALRQDDCQRLRAWNDESAGEFVVWLVVVARRLCVDAERRRFGRRQGSSAASAEQHAARRQLVDLVGDELAVANLPGEDQADPEFLLRAAELRTRLQAALEALAPEDRLILRLRFEDDQSVPAIARTVGLDAPFALYRRIDKLLRGLRETLERAGVGDAAP